MIKSKRLFLFGALAALVLTGAWAIGQQTGSEGDSVTPSDFDPFDEREIPETATIDLEIIGLAQVGQVFMIEGLENETSVTLQGNELSSGATSYPPLVLHGVFDEQMRDWRDDVIDGDFQKRRIEIDLIDSRGSRALRINVLNAWPRSFSFPPLNVDGSTRYMERIEFVYDRFEITN